MTVSRTKQNKDFKHLIPPQHLQDHQNVKNEFRQISSFVAEKSFKANRQRNLQRKYLDKLRISSHEIKEEVFNEAERIKNINVFADQGYVVNLRFQGEQDLLIGDDLAATNRELDRRIDAVREGIFDTQSLEGGVYGRERKERAIVSATQKQFRRLDFLLVKVNKFLANNRELKSVMDSLHKERVVYEEIITRVTNELCKTRKSISRRVNSISVIHHKKLSAVNQLADLHQIVEREHKEFELRWINMGSLQNNSSMLLHSSTSEVCSLHNNALIPAQRRHAEMRMKRKKNEEWRKSKSLMLNKEREESLRFTRAQWQIWNDQTQIQSHEQKLTKIINDISSLEFATGLADADELANQFSMSEQRNFEQFNEINALCVLIAQLENSVLNRNDGVKLSHANECEQSISVCEDRHLVMTNLSIQTETTIKELNRLNTLHKEVTKRLDEIKGPLFTILSQLPLELQDQRRISSSLNILESLDVLERTIDKLLHSMAADSYDTFEGSSSPHTPTLHTNITNNNTYNGICLAVNLPTIRSAAVNHKPSIYRARSATQFSVRRHTNVTFADKYNDKINDANDDDDDDENDDDDDDDDDDDEDDDDDDGDKGKVPIELLSRKRISSAPATRRARRHRS